MSKISIDDADLIIQGIFAKARELDAKPLGAVIVDDGGHVVAYKREDGATSLRFDIARGKAWGAVSLGLNSRKFAEMAEARPTFVSTLGAMTDGKIVPSAGGVLIEKDGHVIGAAGVSGDLPDVDEECAIAGIESAGLNTNAAKAA